MPRLQFQRHVAGPVFGYACNSPVSVRYARRSASTDRVVGKGAPPAPPRARTGANFRQHRLQRPGRGAISENDQRGRAWILHSERHQRNRGYISSGNNRAPYVNRNKLDLARNQIETAS
jgi:hypothetical protein